MSKSFKINKVTTYWEINSKRIVGSRKRNWRTKTKNWNAIKQYEIRSAFVCLESKWWVILSDNEILHLSKRNGIQNPFNLEWWKKWLKEKKKNLIFSIIIIFFIYKFNKINSSAKPQSNLAFWQVWVKISPCPLHNYQRSS